MKTLQNHMLLYDLDCPMCNIYTKGFISCHMLDQNGRKPFVEVNTQEESYIDLAKARNEIALVDTKNKSVIYGIDSLLKVIGNSFPIVEQIGKLSPVYFLLKKLYAFISYNRKVIVPSKKKKLECVPSFNFKYRILFLVFSVVVTSFSLFHFSELLPKITSSSFSRELMIASFQMLFQSVFFIKKGLKTMFSYLGNLMTISLMGSLLLIPVLILNSLIFVPFYVNIILFFAVVLIMFFEHIRRVKLLELPKYLTITWVIYRVLVLIILLNS